MRDCRVRQAESFCQLREEPVVTESAEPRDRDPAERSRKRQLWIDGGGGFLLLSGDRWHVGGAAAQEVSDVCVLADLPRYAGAIERESEDYFWVGQEGRRTLLKSGQALPVSGSAQVRFSRPSQLSGSAVLELSPPHRFAGHVDGIVLFFDTLLIGPGRDCHLRVPRAEETVVLTLRDGRWWVKIPGSSELSELVAGDRWVRGSLSMTLDES